MTDPVDDRQAIAVQLARYAHTFDAHDVGGWVELFTDDGVFEVRLRTSDTPMFRIQGAEQLRTFASHAPQLLHHFSNLVFDELLTESARTRAMVIGTWVLPADGNRPFTRTGSTSSAGPRSKERGGWRTSYSSAPAITQMLSRHHPRQRSPVQRRSDSLPTPAVCAG